MGNWSVILNIILLMGVIIAIARTVKAKRDTPNACKIQPSVGLTDINLPTNNQCDDIISVRRVNQDLPADAPILTQKIEPTVTQQSLHAEVVEKGAAFIVMFLASKDNRQLAGYELLQTLLAAGLRFGEGQLFHRHQHLNGQGPVLCSVAAATSSGVFDLENIGGFSARGLCIFMEPSGNSTIDEERFSIMLETARQLSEDLDTYLLDDKRQLLTDAALNRYCHRLNIQMPSYLAMA